MPNITVRAAAEGLPKTHLSRRAALRGIATLSATAAAGSAVALGDEKRSSLERFDAAAAKYSSREGFSNGVDNPSWREGFRVDPSTASQAEIGKRVHDLAAEMSFLLDHLFGGQWQVQVMPTWNSLPMYELQNMNLPPDARIQKALRRAAGALAIAQPGEWHAGYDLKAGLATITNEAWRGRS